MTELMARRKGTDLFCGHVRCRPPDSHLGHVMPLRWFTPGTWFSKHEDGEGVYFEQRPYIRQARQQGELRRLTLGGRARSEARGPERDVQLEDLPVRVRCGRCGRLSWVTTALVTDGWPHLQA